MPFNTEAMSEGMALRTGSPYIPSSAPVGNNHECRSDPLLRLLLKSRPLVDAYLLFLAQGSNKVQNSPDLQHEIPASISETGIIETFKHNSNAFQRVQTAMEETHALIKNTSSQPKQEYSAKDSEAGASNFDELACHANKIMPMAIDSTFIGSMFDVSCSNTFSNDSYLNQSVLDEDIVESLEEQRMVNHEACVKFKMKTVEINAEDLAAAIS